jgi:hypothetical protein
MSSGRPRDYTPKANVVDLTEPHHVPSKGEEVDELMEEIKPRSKGLSSLLN